MVTAMTLDSDESFWHSAFCSHAPAILSFLEGRLGRREEAEDLLQETFVRAIRAGTFERGGNARAYLLSTARNLLINRFRRPRLVVPAAVPEAGGDPFEAVPDAGASPERQTEWSAFRERLDEVLAAMSEAHRRAFELAIVQQLSYREIAELTGWSESGVKINVYRARRQVVRDLGDALPLA